MIITDELLKSNGWNNYEQFDYFKEMNGFLIDVKTWKLPSPKVWLNKQYLPNVTTMEHLAQLEYLLSPYAVMDTAPIDAAMRARFAEGGGE